MIILDQVYDSNYRTTGLMNTQQIADPQKLFDIIQNFMNTKLHGKNSGITTMTVEIHVSGLNNTKMAVVQMSNAEYNRLIHDNKNIKKWVTEWADLEYKLYENSTSHTYFYMHDEPQKIKQKEAYEMAAFEVENNMK